MIIERGVVTAVDEHLVTVSCRSRMDCLRCAQGKGCGGGILARWLGDRQFQIQAYFDAQDQPPVIGELVEIALPSSRIVKLAAIMYGLPLLIMIVSLLVLVQVFPQVTDFGSLFVAIVSLALGFKLSAILVKRANKNGQLLPRLHTTNFSDLASQANCLTLGANE